MLSGAALIWLQSIGWTDFTYEERTILLQAARILYPADDEKHFENDDQ